ncbi:MAG: hypothetical protein Q8M11_21265 [Sulfuritalea sp.]|nr:hypothetical protein [Sulfuritalea sp.]MDP1984655.1 hypothetical protein [Sulfuritalea sp.]
MKIDGVAINSVVDLREDDEELGLIGISATVTIDGRDHEVLFHSPGGDFPVEMASEDFCHESTERVRALLGDDHEQFRSKVHPVIQSALDAYMEADRARGRGPQG